MCLIDIFKIRKSLHRNEMSNARYVTRTHRYKIRKLTIASGTCCITGCRLAMAPPGNVHDSMDDTADANLYDALRTVLHKFGE
jgi:hypothetical protein